MFFNRISFRIGLWYAFAFLLSALMLFGLTAYLLTDSLQSKDRVLLTARNQEYAALFARDGVRGLQVKASSQEIKDAQSFVVRLADPDGRTLFIYSPDRSDDKDAPTVADLDRELHKADGKKKWLIVEGGGYGDNVEVISEVLPSGETLQVGKDVEDREEFLQSFAHAYFMGIVPIFVLAILVGMLLSNRLLQPIRWLTQTVESIRSGNSKARVELRSTRDELWHLGSLFNQMLEQNEKLFQGMRNTVDNLAHDLRTPVMRMQNSIEKALCGPGEARLFQEALMDCQENSESLLELVDGIMDLSEADAGALSLMRENIAAVQIVEAVMDLYGFVAEEINISLSAHFIETFEFLGDRVRMIQTLSNIVDNAIKYSPRETSVVIEVAVESDIGVIRVIDQGIGIPENELTRIWDRLYRVDKSRSSKGLGLGLSVVKAIVSAHGGEVGASSNSDRGTTFFIKLKTNKSIV